MKRCLITLDPIPETTHYSQKGLHLLSPKLKSLLPFNYSIKEQHHEFVNRAGKMSIQGVQAKLSTRLKVQDGYFELVDSGGEYILKPQSDHFPEVPQNEAITMTLASTIGLEVPVHGLLYTKDQTLIYFIKRFDRGAHHRKLALEDFAQLSQSSRDNKYNSSMERVAEIIQQYCSFPVIELSKLFRLSLFNFLIGNEDMHLKNFSLITRNGNITLSPAYDLLNSTIAIGLAKEELALPLNGKKNNLKRRDFFNYFAEEKLQLTPGFIAKTEREFITQLPEWYKLIEQSFLSPSMQKKYIELIDERRNRLQI